MKKALLLLILLIGLFSFSFAQNKSDKELETLLKYMQGNFSSKQQSLSDTDYFHISLKMKRIWKDKNIGNWLYVEQAMASSLNKPYRQRVYHVYRKGEKLVSEVFTLANPKQFVGATKHSKLFDIINPDSLLLRKGCEITLYINQQLYVGTTTDKNCSSDLRGAQYAISEVVIGPNRLLSWDRGFNKDGVQVWGATKGGYIFIKE